MSLSGHNGTVRAVKFSRVDTARGGVLASVGAGDCAVRIWDISAGCCCAMYYFKSVCYHIVAFISEKCTHAFVGHEAHVHAVDWLDTYTVVSGDEKGWMVCHDIRSPQYVWRTAVPQHGICAIATIPDCLGATSNDVFLGLTKGFVSLYSPLQQRFILAPERVHVDDVRCVLAWETPTSSRSAQRRRKVSVLTTSFDHTAAVWDVQVSSPAGGRGSATATSEQKLVKTAMLSHGHSDKILCATRFPLSGSIMTTGADGKAVLWQ